MANQTSGRPAVAAVPPQPHTQESLKDRRQRFGALSHQAAKGRYPTLAKPPVVVASAAPQDSATTPKADPELASTAETTKPAEAETVQGQTGPVQGDRADEPTRAHLSMAPPPAQPSDLPSAPTTDSAMRGEIVVSISAARALTELFMGLILEPGSGAEVPREERAHTLNQLIAVSHQTADRLCQIIVDNPLAVAPIALRAKMLQACAEHFTNQWAESGTLDPEPLVALARAAFSGKVDSLTNEITTLMHHAAEYLPVDSQQAHDISVTDACFDVFSRSLSVVRRFHLRDYDESGWKNDDEGLFSYGRKAQDVARDLARITLELAGENRLDIDNLDLSSTWIRHTLDRASKLVLSEYAMITDRALRTAFSDNLTAPAALADIKGRYVSILSNVAKRARQDYMNIERDAVDCMSATAYKHYLPKAHSEQPVKPTAETPEQAQAPTASPMPAVRATLPVAPPPKQARASNVAHAPVTPTTPFRPKGA